MLSKDQLNKIKFTNLHQHTTYSVLDGIGTVKDHIKESILKGHNGLAITDHGTMAGCLQLYRLTKDKDFLKSINSPTMPGILGNELYIVDDLMERDPKNKYNHITVLVKNSVGYKNLCYLTSIASTDDHFYSRPRVSLSELLEHKEGLIVTSGCYMGMIPQSIVKKTGKEDELVKLFKDEFGDDFYLELHLSDIGMKWDKEKRCHCHQGFNPQEEVNLGLIDLAKKHDVKIIITQDSHMPKKENYSIQTIMIANSPSGKDGWHFPEAYYTMTVEEMYSKSQKNCKYISDDDFIKYCDNTQEVVAKCQNLELIFEPSLPKIDYSGFNLSTPELNGKFNELKTAYADDKDFQVMLARAEQDISLKTALLLIIKLNKINLSNSTYRAKLTYECGVIQFNGVIDLMDYFLLLADVTVFVKENGHMRGFGRGSAASSLVVYALDITDVDPIKNDLSFERFLTQPRLGIKMFRSDEFVIP